MDDSAPTTNVADGESPPQPRGPRWLLFAVLGWVFVGVAVLGAMLPVLPTTPFLLLACGCFARSSPTWNRWLVRSPVFGPVLHDWQRHRGIRPHVRLTAVVTILVVGGLSLSWGGLAAWAKWLVGGLLAMGLVVVVRLPAARDEGEKEAGSRLAPRE